MWRLQKSSALAPLPLKTVQISISSPPPFTKTFSSLTALTSIKSRTKGLFKSSSAPQKASEIISRAFFIYLVILYIRSAACVEKRQVLYKRIVKIEIEVLTMYILIPTFNVSNA